MSDFLQIIEASMLNDINRIAVSSNNVSNITTNGYKRDVVVGDLFDAQIKAEYINSKPQLDVTRNEALKSITDLRIGGAKKTGNPFNFVIAGKGYFSIEKDGDLVLTRNGDFSLNESGYLVTQDGYLVLGDNGYIRLSTNKPTLNEYGELLDDAKVVSRLQVVQLQDNYASSAIRKDDQGYLVADESYLKSNESVNIVQGFLEGSNVDGAFEMINTLETMRHFELNQRLLNMNQEMFKTSLDTLGNY